MIFETPLPLLSPGYDHQGRIGGGGGGGGGLIKGAEAPPPPPPPPPLWKILDPNHGQQQLPQDSNAV